MNRLASILIRNYEPVVKKMTADKRKRTREEEEEVLDNHPQVLPEEAPAKPPELKRHNNGPSGLLTLAIKKIVELEKYVNQDAEEEHSGEVDYNSDSSDSSDSGRCDGRSTISGDSGSVDNNDRVMRREGSSFCPEIVGFAVCAQETMNFLRREGFSEDHSLIQSMQQRLLEQITQYQVSLNGGD